MGKGDSSVIAKQRASRQRRKIDKLAMRSEFALAELPRRLKGKSRRRANKPAEAKKLKPTPKQEERLLLLNGKSGCADDPLAPAKAHGYLTECQAEALHRYRQIAQAYSRSVQAPHLAPDILSTLEPIGAGSTITDDAARQIKIAYIGAWDAMRPATRKQVSTVEWLVSAWGCTISDVTCETLSYPATLLAEHWGLAQNSKAE